VKKVATTAPREKKVVGEMGGKIPKSQGAIFYTAKGTVKQVVW
jgi:hypothetical protein